MAQWWERSRPHQCGQGSIPARTRRRSRFLLVPAGLAPWLRFFTLLKNQHFQIQIRSGTKDEKPLRGCVTANSHFYFFVERSLDSTWAQMQTWELFYDTAIPQFDSKAESP